MTIAIDERHKGKKLGLIALCATIGLAGCTEKEEILPGKRESINSVLSNRLVADEDAGQDQQGSIAAAIALPAQTVNATARQFAGSPEYRTDHPSLGNALTRVWSVNIGSGDGRKERITADPVVGDGLIFTLDANTQVTAVSVNGSVAWTRDVRPGRDKDGDATGGGLAVQDDTLFVTSGFGRIVALDTATGEIKWEQDLDATASGAPLVHDNLVYVTAGDSSGWAIEADTGRVAWQIGAAESVTNVLGAPAPVLAGDLVVFSFGTGELQAVFRQGGLRRWDSSVLGERKGRSLSKIDDVTGAPVVADNVLYAGSQAGRTVAINAGSGARVWTAREGAISPVLPVGGSVFLVSDRNQLLRLDGATGDVIWREALPNFVKPKPRKAAEVFAHHGPILAGGRLVVASNDGVLRSFSPEDGSLVGTAEIPDGATTRPVVAGQTLYVVGRKGQLHAFR
ncbi:MAG: PQQ-binding-like beta-propeller repeat protein [Paracoccaceae bacterium]